MKITDEMRKSVADVRLKDGWYAKTIEDDVDTPTTCEVTIFGPFARFAHLMLDASSKMYANHVCDIFKVADGKILDTHVSYDDDAVTEYLLITNQPEGE